MKLKYLSDEEIEKKLHVIYIKINNLLKVRMNGAEQYDKYNTKTIALLKDFIITYEKEYGGK
jgi:DNA-dependent RNA polymerase auxiliary subunit epsilon